MSKVSEAIKAKRNKRSIDNLPDNLDANDPLVRKAHKGQGWGAQDQARYDKLKSSGEYKTAVQPEEGRSFDGKGGEGGGKIAVQPEEGRSFDGKGEEGVSKIAVQPEEGRSFDGKGGEAKERAQNYMKNPNNVPKTSGDVQHQQMNQNANQDNDVTSTVTGDNNNVRINQDNSVRQYGGVNKSFIYNGGSNGNNYEDTPVSAGTIGGYFHDEDSPGRSASFVDRYSTMNADNQKKYKNSTTAQDAIDAASKNEAINIGALDQKINDRAKASRARSTVMAGSIFGDMFNYRPESWRNADKMEEVETPDFEKLGKI